eukprot:12760591-Ditylum_brightwellii.AAC.1
MKNKQELSLGVIAKPLKRPEGDNPNTGSWVNDSCAFSIVLHEVRHGNGLYRTSQNVTEQTPSFWKDDGPVATYYFAA